MVEKIKDKDNLDELILLINKYSAKARDKIMNLLTKTYGFDDETSTKIENSINISTKSTMTDKYKFKDLYLLPVSRFKTETKTFLSLSNEYADFVDWYWTVTMVPLYQSLGDTIGYYWEFNYDEVNPGPEFVNTLIYDFISLGGINDLSIVNWSASDDTILYMTTLQVLTEHILTITEYGSRLRIAYIKAIPLMENRHPGTTIMNSLNIQKHIKWNKLSYNNNDIGSGAAMRSGCIGILYPGKNNRKKLIALAVETSRITHNSAIAILGSVVAALFTAYALEKVSINHWPHKLLRLLKSNKIDEYMKDSRPNEYKFYVRDKVLFIGQWEKYINMRFSGLNPKSDLKYMKNPVTRFKILSENFSKANPSFPGSLGDDSVIFAYDALLESGNVLEKLIVYAILHPGDSDTVGSIALSWFGAYYHSLKNQELVESKFDQLEYRKELLGIFKHSIARIVKIYYYDIYLDIAKKYLKQFVKKENLK